MKKLLLLLLLSLSFQFGYSQSVSMKCPKKVEVGIDNDFIANFDKAGQSITVTSYEWTAPFLEGSGESGIKGNINGFTELADITPYIDATSDLKDTVYMAWGDGQIITSDVASVTVHYNKNGTDHTVSNSCNIGIWRVFTPVISGSSKLQECCTKALTYCDNSTGDQDSWEWTVTGGTIASGQGTKCITITPSSETAGLTIDCEAWRQDAHEDYFRSSSKSISRYKPNLKIEGSETACLNSTLTYKISGADVSCLSSIVWTVSSDISILSGQGTGQITISTNSTNGSISVTADSGCKILSASSTLNQSEDKHYYTNSSIDDELILAGSIVVHDGATLTINAAITFFNGKGIYIKDGGKVILNSTLTACDRWNGVRVYGGGEFESKNDAVIEHAVWGIATTSGNYFLGTGKITCKGTVFRNNGVGAMIATKNGVEIDRKPYDADFSNNCRFYNDDNMRHEKFWAFITSYNIKGTDDDPIGVRVKDCEFKDTQHDYDYPNKWNSGIVALNGDIAVWGSHFTNLYSGIEARTGVSENPRLIVAGNLFKNCTYGVINSGITSSGFAANFFAFGSPYLATDEYQVGVLLQDNMNTTYFQDNRFAYSVDSDPINFNGSIGTYINNIGTSKTNLIRRNYYTNVDYANMAIGNNANPDGGLLYLCNLNQYNKTIDFLGALGFALRKEQGKAKDDDFLPSGNTFSHMTWDFFNFGPKANYYHDGSNAQKPGGTSGNTGSFTGINPKLRSADDHCADPEERAELTTEAEAIQNEQEYIKFWNAHQTALQDFENAKSSGNVELAKTKKAHLTFEGENMERVVALGYDYAQKHSSKGDVRKWIRRFNNATGDYLLVGDYFSTGEYHQGLKILSEMSFKRNLSEKEMIDLEKVEHIYKTIAKEGLDKLNASFLSDLESYATSKEGKSCFLARTILRNYGQYYTPIINIPSGSKDNNSSEEGEIQKKMLISPNPTDYHVIFDWTKFGASNKEVRIEISNQTGLLIDVLHPTTGSTSMNWTTENVTGNSCHYGLFIDGQEVDSGQIIINK